MNAALAIQSEQPANIVELPKPVRRIHKGAQRFRVVPFTNERTGSQSWRVSGIKRDGTRVRENYQEQPSAQVRQIELETEWLKGEAQTSVRATKLTDDQVRLAESAFIQLGDDWQRIVDAVLYWKQHGRQNAIVESPRIDDAVEKFVAWLDKPDARGKRGKIIKDATKRGWKIRLNVFKNTVPNSRVADVTPDFIENQFLAKLTVTDKDTVRRAVSRFFSWCIKQKWAAVNPCHAVETPKAAGGAPKILSVEQCKALLRAAEGHKGGKLVPYVALCLFAGIRPNGEAQRLSWAQINLTDGEIRVDESKTGPPRVFKMMPTLKAWLKAFKGREVYPSNWRKDFAAVRKAAGITNWPPDVMRHTAISHYFRDCGSYGLTAEAFGNSEAIIKAHYQGQVNSDDTKKFYALLPKGKAKK
jgi:integrase